MNGSYASDERYSQNGELLRSRRSELTNPAGRANSPLRMNEETDGASQTADNVLCGGRKCDERRDAPTSAEAWYAKLIRRVCDESSAALRWQDRMKPP